MELDWKAFVAKTDEEIVTFECGLGFGNNTFTCSYLPNIFYIYAVSDPENFESLQSNLLNAVLTFLFYYLLILIQPFLSFSFYSFFFSFFLLVIIFKV